MAPHDTPTSAGTHPCPCRRPVTRATTLVRVEPARLAQTPRQSSARELEDLTASEADAHSKEQMVRGMLPSLRISQSSPPRHAPVGHLTRLVASPPGNSRAKSDAGRSSRIGPPMVLLAKLLGDSPGMVALRDK